MCGIFLWVEFRNLEDSLFLKVFCCNLHSHEYGGICMSRERKFSLRNPECDSYIEYLVNTEGYGDFIDYVAERMESNRPIRLKIIDGDDVFIHPLLYSKYVINVE